jgi:uncharacterized protein (DUF58 family)
MTRRLTPKFAPYAALAAAGLLAALATRLPELVALAAPFALLPIVSLLLARPPQVAIEVTIDRDRVLEGDEVEVVVALDAAVGVDRLDVFVELPHDVELLEGENPATIRLRDGQTRELRYRLVCARWGAFRIGRVFLRARDVLGFASWEWVEDRRAAVKVFPREEAVRTLLRPAETQVFSGNHVARQKAEGIEFADLRPFVAGDRIRHVNWRATARRGELWINEQHPERNSDVILILDTFTEATSDGLSTLDHAVRGAASLAARYLRHKDRVGFVTFGGMLNWLLPSTGTAQLYRIIDSLLDTQIVLNYAWKDIHVLPPRTLPPQALVIALTPLLDDRAAGALLDLRARRFDLVVVEISPEPFLEAPRTEVERLGRRLWTLKREALRGRFAAAGVPVTTWDDERPLAQAIEEVTTFRRSARVASA